MSLNYDVWASFKRTHQTVREKVFMDWTYSPEPPGSISIAVRSGSGLSQTVIGERLTDFRLDFPAIMREDTDRPVTPEPWIAARVVIKGNKDMLDGTHWIELIEILD